jgi:hypothetical protein
MPFEGVQPDVPSNTLVENTMDAAAADLGTRPVAGICIEELKVSEEMKVFVAVPGLVDTKVPEKLKFSVAAKISVPVKLL